MSRPAPAPRLGHRSLRAALAAALFAGAVPARAQGGDGKPDWLDLYDNDANPVVQSVTIVGRYHGQYASLDAAQGHFNDWENRRFYLGAEALLFRELTLHAQVEISDDFDPVYEGLYQAYAGWAPHEDFSVRVGRLDFLFAGLERTVSSTKIVTFERGLLANQLMPGEVVGAVAQGETGELSYRAGLFSGSIEQEFTHFDGGAGAVTGVGHVLPLVFETGSLHLDWVYNNGNTANDALAPYDHVLALWHQGQAGRFGLGVDVTWGHGLDARPDVVGVTLLPTFVLAEDLLREGDVLQAVLRYQHAASDGANGLELQGRYEQEVAAGSAGDRYNAVYGAINYRIFGDSLKLMAGMEYAEMDDPAQDGGAYDGWTYLAGARTFF